MTCDEQLTRCCFLWWRAVPGSLHKPAPLDIDFNRVTTPSPLSFMRCGSPVDLSPYSTSLTPTPPQPTPSTTPPPLASLDNSGSVSLIRSFADYPMHPSFIRAASPAPLRASTPSFAAIALPQRPRTASPTLMFYQGGGLASARSLPTFSSSAAQPEPDAFRPIHKPHAQRTTSRQERLAS